MFGRVRDFWASVCVGLALASSACKSSIEPKGQRSAVAAQQEEGARADVVVSSSVGPEESVVASEELPGFELRIPAAAFAEQAKVFVEYYAAQRVLRVRAEPSIQISLPLQLKLPAGMTTPEGETASELRVSFADVKTLDDALAAEGDPLTVVAGDGEHLVYLTAWGFVRVRFEQALVYEAALELSIDAHDFGIKPLGASHSFDVTVENTADYEAAALEFKSSGPSFAFAPAATDLPACGTTLAAGASCGARVSFTPTIAGAKSGSATLSYEAPDGTSVAVVVTLTGTGRRDMPIGRGFVTTKTLRVHPELSLPVESCTLNGSPITTSAAGDGWLKISGLTPGTTYTVACSAGIEYAETQVRTLATDDVVLAAAGVDQDGTPVIPNCFNFLSPRYRVTDGLPFVFSQSKYLGTRTTCAAYYDGLEWHVLRLSGAEPPYGSLDYNVPASLAATNDGVMYGLDVAYSTAGSTNVSRLRRCAGPDCSSPTDWTALEFPYVPFQNLEGSLRLVGI